MTTETNYARAQAAGALESIIELMDRLKDANEDLDYRAVEEIQQEIYEDPLEVYLEKEDIDEDDYEADAELTGRYIILLSTGGPATRIVGRLDEYNTPLTAWFEYQDWGTPWTFYANHNALVEYARQFYFESV